MQAIKLADHYSKNFIFGSSMSAILGIFFIAKKGCE